MVLTIPRLQVQENIPLAPFTTYKIGGPADYFLKATSPRQIIDALNTANKSNLPVFILGTGANILIGDKGFRGLVIHNQTSAVNFNGNQITAESGAVIADLIEASADLNLSGLEHFAGIPSSVGGALWQNLHFLAPNRKDTVFIGDILKSAKIIGENLTVSTVGPDFFEFGYDDSILHYKKITVLSATFNLTPSRKVKIRHQINENLEWRRQRHPDYRKLPSAGSVFKKIEGVGAGRLIDATGLKGHQLGGAKVSEKHANFIVNTGQATAQDVRQLIELVQQEVLKNSGYHLEPEISFIGEF